MSTNCVGSSSCWMTSKRTMPGSWMLLRPLRSVAVLKASTESALTWTKTWTMSMVGEVVGLRQSNGEPSARTQEPATVESWYSRFPHHGQRRLERDPGTLLRRHVRRDPRPDRLRRHTAAIPDRLQCPEEADEIDHPFA